MGKSFPIISLVPNIWLVATRYMAEGLTVEAPLRTLPNILDYKTIPVIFGCDEIP